MAVYKRTYKAYRGPLTPSWSRFMVLSRYGFSTLFASRSFTADFWLCKIPSQVRLAFICLANNASVQALLNLQREQYSTIGNTWFMRFLGVEGWMGFVLAAWAVPGMISKDFANHGI